MRIIILLLAVFFILMIVKYLLRINGEKRKSTKKSIIFCKNCKSYVVKDDYCGGADNYMNCSNFK